MDDKNKTKLENLVMIPIPITIEKDIFDKDLTDLQWRVDPKSNFFKALTDYMKDGSCSSVWLTKPKSRPHFFDIEQKPFFERIPKQYSDELKALLSNCGGKLLILEPYDLSAEFVNLETLKDGLYAACASLFVQSIYHIDKTSDILYHLHKKPPEGNKRKGVSSELNQCCLSHLIFNKRTKGFDVELRVLIVGHSNHTNTPHQDSLAKWFSLVHQR